MHFKCFYRCIFLYFSNTDVLFSEIDFTCSKLNFPLKVMLMFGIAFIPFAAVEETDDAFLCDQKL